MSLFPPYPIGARIPDSPHAVCCSLPTMKDVIGYEEEDPNVRKHVVTGYPRFVEHDYLRRLAKLVRLEWKLTGRAVSLAPSRRAAEGLQAFLAPAETNLGTWKTLYVVAFPDRPEHKRKARRYFQHTGCGVSSRQAEDLLHETGQLDAIHPETAQEDNPRNSLMRSLHDACPEANPEHILLARSGMNAFYSAFTAARRLQQPQGKNIWIQLGWLYLDTIRILETFLSPKEHHIILPDAGDFAPLEDLFSRDGSRIAGVITETPTNPLLQTADLARVRELCDRHGSLLFVDPSLSSFHNLDVYRHADVVLHSLTKYFGYEGDVMMGLAAFNPARSEFAGHWLELAREIHEPPYQRDILRLAAQAGTSGAIVERINRNTGEVAAFLENHPAVKRVHWAGSAATRTAYERLARGPGRPGGILTLDLNIPLADFYDAAPFVKGPSFGTRFTMMCPFMYLAHYDLVSSPEGRDRLRAHGIDPDLVRVSIGAEPAEEIIEGFQQSLGRV